MSTPEAIARLQIDAALEAAGWLVQDRATLNLHAARGVAVREVTLKPGYGEADYLLFVDAHAVGAVEAKKIGSTLTGVETQSAKYGDGLPNHYPALIRPLPILYESTGVETHLTNRLDPDPRSRPASISAETAVVPPPTPPIPSPPPAPPLSSTAPPPAQPPRLPCSPHGARTPLFQPVRPVHTPPPNTAAPSSPSPPPPNPT